MPQGIQAFLLFLNAEQLPEERNSCTRPHHPAGSSPRSGPFPTGARYGVMTLLGDGGMVEDFLSTRLTAPESERLWLMLESLRIFLTLTNISKPLRPTRTLAVALENHLVWSRSTVGHYTRCRSAARRCDIYSPRAHDYLGKV